MEDNKAGINSGKGGSGGELSVAQFSVFNRSKHFLFIYKKTEKLVTAVYMITNFIKDTEPLKWRIRERALELMSLNMSFNTVSLSERKELLREYQAISIEIVSLTSIAYHSGLISEMNATILKTEFESLVETIERGENRQANEETIIINPDFFNAPLTEPSTLPSAPATSTQSRATDSSAVLYKGHASTPVIRPRNMSFTASRPEIKIKKDISTPVATSLGRSTNTGEVKGDRKAVILSILSKKEGLSVKDFVDALKGVSEKTIQRELLSMVASGTIKKEGERRWSRYFMPKS
jgi:hypothetical protein